MRRVGFVNARKSKSIGTSDLEVQQQLSATFGIPTWLWRAKEQDSNGYFFGSFLPSNEGNVPRRHVSVFRFMVKYVTSIGPDRKGSIPEIKYDWHILTFVVHWEAPRGVTLLCFNASPEVQSDLRLALQSASTSNITAWPFALHAIILDVVVELYDKSVWQFRDHVRKLERHRPTMADSKPDYVAMHELARHVTHSSEVITTALNVMENLIWELQKVEDVRTHQFEIGDPAPEIRHQRSMLQFMRNRSLALESRLSNEINLAFHITSQNASQNSTHIAHAARVDSSATKTIAVLGLLFLPGTFVSSIFSMSFFDCSGKTATEPDGWHVSEKIWMFWAAAIPITIVVMGVWWYWQHRLQRTRAL